MKSVKYQRIASLGYSLRIGIICIGYVSNRWGSAFHVCSTTLITEKGKTMAFTRSMNVEPEIVKLGDSGQPFVHFKKETQTAKIMNEIINRITSYIKKQ